jgi:hypothetical protein
MYLGVIEQERLCKVRENREQSHVPMTDNAEQCNTFDVFPSAQTFVNLDPFNSRRQDRQCLDHHYQDLCRTLARVLST